MKEFKVGDKVSVLLSEGHHWRCHWRYDRPGLANWFTTTVLTVTDDGVSVALPVALANDGRTEDGICYVEVGKGTQCSGQVILLPDEKEEEKAPEFLIRILYKSGNSQELWVTEFSVTKASGMYEWKLANDKQKVLLLGADDIEAVFQVDARNV